MVGPPVLVNDLNLRPSPAPEQLLSHVISPIKTFTGYLNGSYNFDALGNAELYGEALFTRRDSHQDFATQLNTQGALGPQAQLFGGTYYGTPLEDYGLPVSPFFPTSWAAAGINAFSPFIVPDKLQHTSQRIDYFRGNVGLRGDLGFGNWRYDGNFQVSRTRSMEDVVNPTGTRLTNALDAVVAPAGTPTSVITNGLPGQTGAGIGYTCASNVTSGAYNGGNCVPLDIFDPQILLNGHIPNNVYNYIFIDNIDRTHLIRIRRSWCWMELCSTCKAVIPMRQLALSIATITSAMSPRRRLSQATFTIELQPELLKARTWSMSSSARSTFRS